MIEKKYEEKKLNDYKLINTNDLLDVHCVDCKVVDGYNELKDSNKEIYEKFIINFYNARGLEARENLIPKGIYYVEEISYLVEADPTEEYFNNYKTEILSINRDGTKWLIHEYVDTDFEHFEVVKIELEKYLRFEYEYIYEEERRSDWLHVTMGGTEWY